MKDNYCRKYQEQGNQVFQCSVDIPFSHFRESIKDRKLRNVKNYITKKDRFHLKISKKLSRILITLDRDFLAYNRFSLENHPGVIVISVGSATAPNVNKVCKKALKKIVLRPEQIRVLK